MQQFKGTLHNWRLIHDEEGYKITGICKDERITSTLILINFESCIVKTHDSFYCLGNPENNN